MVDGCGHPSTMLDAATAANDLDLISFLKAIPDTRMRRGIQMPAWNMLQVAVLGILSKCESLRDPERFARRHNAVLTERFALSSSVRRRIQPLVTSYCRWMWRPSAPLSVNGR